MKKVKLTFWLLVVVFLGLLIWQNQSFFFTRHSLELNLGFTHRVTPGLPNLVFIVMFFAAGLLVAYLSSLLERFRAGKTIRELKNTNKSHQDTIAQMRREVDALKQPSSSPPETPGTQDIEGDEASQPQATESAAQPPQS